MSERFPFDPALVEVEAGPGLAAALGLPDRPIHVEVGFGKDVRILRAAETDPETVHVGVEVSKKKLLKFCRKAARADLRNVRAVLCDVRKLLPELPGGSVLSFTVLFPDPWPKRRHHKHRWIAAESAAHLRRTLVPGGSVVVATDDTDYIVQITAAMRDAGFELAEETATVPRGDRTLFAERFERLGRRVRYQVWR